MNSSHHKSPAERCTLDLETLLRVPYVEPYMGYDLSPDGAQIAFSWNTTGQWEIYRMPIHEQALARQVTSGPGAKFSPRWSPDGHRLAYALDRDGGEAYDIYVGHPATGKQINLTPNTSEAIQPGFCWSPDGQWMVFASDRSGCFDTYVLPAAGGPTRRILSLPYPDWKVYWSPDGWRLAVIAHTHSQDTWIFIVPLEGGEAYAVADANDPISTKSLCWSPDGARIAFASRRKEDAADSNIGVYDLATGQIAWLTEEEGSKEQVTWSPDGRKLAYVVQQGPVNELAVLELESQAVASYQVGPGVHYLPRFADDGSHLVFGFDNPGQPCDLWLLALANGSLRQLTHSLPPELQDARFAVPQSVRYPSLDGQSVPALLYRPHPLKGPGPAVVHVHGGPNWLTQVTWDPLVQHLVSRGWAVLAPNYRGSTGYGREWERANRFDLGGGDTKDVVAGVDYLIDQGIADPARIAVTGRSWGGYLTMTALTQYPNYWAVGSAVVPFLNWFTAHANSREDLQHWDIENFGHPVKDYDLWYERSPFFFLDRVAAPVQLICGAHDVRCPASESIQTRDTLAAQGKPCDLVLYPDEGHVFLKIENVIDAEKRRVAFLAAALEKE